MSWKPKRFWATTSAEPCEGGFRVLLDARVVKTPGKAPVVVPTLALAQAIAAEWGAQHGLVRPQTMPFSRAANSAIDKVAVQFDVVAAGLSAYGASDLLCYRATAQPDLLTLQAAGWDPLLHWAATDLGAPLTVTQGVIPVAQPETSTARLHAIVAAMTPFQIVALHDLVALSGSLILALAVTRGRLSPAAAWDLSRIDETWQIAQWGADEEAAALTESKRQDFHQAATLWTLLLPN